MTSRRVTAPALTATRRDAVEPAEGVTPARRDSTDVATRRVTPRHIAVPRAASRYVRAAVRAVPRGSLTTVTAARHVKRLGVKPTDTLTVWRLRQLYRFFDSPVGVVLLVLLGATGAWVATQHPGWVEPAGRFGFVLLCVLALWLGWAIAEATVTWPHRARWVNELGYALRDPKLLDLSPDIPAAKFVKWPANFGEAGTEMCIKLPRGWVGYGEDRDNLLLAVQEVGGFRHDDLNHKFVLSGPYSELRLTPREKLIIPNLVRATDPEIVALLEQVRRGRPLLALGRGGMHILGDLGGDAPHMGFSMRTGGGKSNHLKGVIAQEMHLGASVVILDLKRRSLKCFKGLEGVLYCREVSEIHEALIACYREADHRNRLADELGDDEEPPWQRRLIVMEEQNSTIDELNDYWLQIREPGDPRVSPAVRAYRKIGNMARGVDMNLLAIFQRITAQAAGGATARDNFGMVVVSKPKPALWKMVADEIPFPNVAGKPRGRSWFICDGEAPEGQALLWTDRAARAWASSGLSSKVRAYDPSRGSHTPRSQGKRPASVAGTAIEATASEPGDERLFSIRDASSDRGVGIVQATHQTLRGKRVTDPEFPEHDAIDGQKKLYRAETLRRWEANREAVPA
jgi:hypothetical protein